jgi:uncharacterized protein YndB with AHSA1/START domain
MSKWLPPNGFTGKVHQMDAKVGGIYRMSFTNFSTGKAILSVEHMSSCNHTSAFATQTNSMTRTCPGEMQTTITLKQVFCGTELNIVQEGVPGAIPPEACYLGWQESLTLLSKLVEAEIPD